MSNYSEATDAIRQADPAPADVLRMEGPLTVFTAAEWRSRMAGWLAASRNPVLDLTGVTQCDTAGVQLLCAAFATCRLKKQTLSILRSSNPIDSVCGALGLPGEALSIQQKTL